VIAVIDTEVILHAITFISLFFNSFLCMPCFDKSLIPMLAQQEEQHKDLQARTNEAHALVCL
jgi:hypothetical protein